MPDELTVLERDVPLSHSLLFERQRQFYKERGLRVWSEDRVPQFITNNPFIAGIYAEIVFCFLDDCRALPPPERPSPHAPLRILELGAGPGRFAFLFLRRLLALLEEHGLPAETVRYGMTDCSPAVLEAWRANPRLAELVERGLLHFEHLDAGEPIASRFLEETAGPLVVVANYVFDSLPQDVFAIQEGRLFEALLTTRAPRAGAEGRPPALSALQLSFRNASLEPGRYSDDSWNRILEGYRARWPAATVSLPVAALRLLDELHRLAGRVLVLAADKGLPYEEALELYQGPPSFEFHAPECFSQMVNFDAIAKHCAARGGEALLPAKQAPSLALCGFLLGQPGDRFPATRTAYRQAQDAFGPDDLFTLLGWLNAQLESLSIPQVLAVLRLSRWDPVTLLRLFPVIARQVRGVVRERSDLREAVLRTWDNYFPVHPEENALAFDCGVILLELHFFEDAMPLFRASQRELGPSAATSYNLGLCAQGRGRPQEALAFMEEACKLDPNFEPARLARLKLEKKG